MKQVYFYDKKTGQLTGSEQVSDTLVITVGITDVPVPRDLVNPKFNVTNQTWIGTNLEDWLEKQQVNYQQLLKEHSELIPDETKQLMQQSQLALQQAQFQASQQKLNSQLALQLAQIIAKEAQNV